MREGLLLVVGGNDDPNHRAVLCATFTGLREDHSVGRGDPEDVLVTIWEGRVESPPNIREDLPECNRRSPVPKTEGLFPIPNMLGLIPSGGQWMCARRPTFSAMSEVQNHDGPLPVGGVFGVTFEMGRLV